MQIFGFGRVIFWDGGSLWMGLVAAPVELHAHHSIQICAALRGEVQFKAEHDEHWTRYAGALVPSDLPHCFQAPSTKVAMIFSEPESPSGSRLLHRFGRTGIAALSEPEVQRLTFSLAEAYDRAASDEELASLARHALAELVGNVDEPAPQDGRIRKAIAEIERRIDEPLALSEIADVAGLSEDRFRHLFVAETGLPFRVFVLWKRLNVALELGFGGTSWTEAAHAANFADSAHLTRTCRRMFGITPTALRPDTAPHSGQISA